MLVKVIINGSEYYAIYNAQTDTYELSLSAPLIGGVYEVTAEATDVTGESDTETRLLRVLKKQIEEYANKQEPMRFLKAKGDLEKKLNLLKEIELQNTSEKIYNTKVKELQELFNTGGWKE